ncbi:5,6-dimethylbenzimidazole synthase [Mycolicibacterium phocaicum]|nr:5,6-dimethylbenzimidazole synthase [Mycolicibacterium phocaicum]UCZ59768.1 5,6-dimethylbenzimidazole synthase [Mycolicibacterium phocaicum]
MSEPSYSDAERAAVYRVMSERRDMRHFTPNSQVPEDVLRRILEAAHMAPSVGLMQPWRFLRITDPATRAAIKELVDAERIQTGEALGPREAEFLALKVEGIGDCAELFVVALGDDRERHIFGRRTMPHMDLASVSCAIQNMWLAARAEGLGLGWVSLFEPTELAALLGMPAGADPIAVLCVGPVPEFPDRPELEIVGWTTARPLDELVYTNIWPV